MTAAPPPTWESAEYGVRRNDMFGPLPAEPGGEQLSILGGAE